MRAPDWLPMGVGILFGAISIASVAIARHFPRERRYDQYGTACVLAAASLGLVGGQLVPEQGPWDPWLIGCYLVGMMAALWNFRRGRRARAESAAAQRTSEIAAEPSNDR